MLGLQQHGLTGHVSSCCTVVVTHQADTDAALFIRVVKFYTNAALPSAAVSVTAIVSCAGALA